MRERTGREGEGDTGEGEGQMEGKRQEKKDRAEGREGILRNGEDGERES